MKYADSKAWETYQLSSGMERKYVDLAIQEIPVDAHEGVRYLQTGE